MRRHRRPGGRLGSALLTAVLAGWLVAGLQGVAAGSAPDDNAAAASEAPEAVEAAEPVAVARALSLLAPRNASELDRQFRMRGFSLQAIAEGRGAVPRLYVVGLPDDLDRVRSVELRKTLFIRSVLPLVLMVNEELRGQRRVLLDLQARLQAGEELDSFDAAWLAALAEHYGQAELDLEALLLQVAEVPVSLALAQAIVESGWGTSRLAREDNALFGQRATRARYLGFGDLMGSVRAYAHNLNTHSSYASFRERRAEMLAARSPLDGHNLAAALDGYAENRNYASYLRGIIRSNRLQHFETARLADGILTANRAMPRLLPDG